MPWREQVDDVARNRSSSAWREQEGVNFAALCRRFGISRTTGYTAGCGAIGLQGVAGLADRSRRPAHHADTAPRRPWRRAVRGAARCPSGLGRSQARAPRSRTVPSATVPAASTCTAHPATAHDRLDPAESAKHTAWQRFEHAAPNDLWQIDFKGHCRRWPRAAATR